MQTKLRVSERRACTVLVQPRSTQRYRPSPPSDEERLVTRIVELASKYGRYGYRRITALLRREGWQVNHKRVERLWRREGLKVPKRQRKRGRLWFNDGSCVRLRPQHRHHVWSYDFVANRTHDGRPIRMLTVIDEYSRECLAIEVERRLRSDDVLETLTRLFTERGPPAFLRSDNGPDFTAASVREWLGRVGVQTAFIEPGSPWENGYNESFNGKLRDASEAMGESPTERRDRTAAQWRDLLHAARGPGAHRGLASRIQRVPSVQFTGAATSGTRGLAALRTDCGGRLTFKVVQGCGAGQYRAAYSSPSDDANR